MTRPKRPTTRKTGATKTGAGKAGSGARGAAGSGKPSRGRGPQKSAARGRDGTTRDSSKVAREPGLTGTTSSEERTPTLGRSSEGRHYGSASSTTRSSAGRSSNSRTSTGRTQSRSDGGRAAPPKVEKKKPLPDLKRVQLDAPPPNTEFRDRDGQKLTFPDSNLRRVAAQILTDRRKAWRYRPFPFPLFTDKGHEQAFHFDFYVYDAEDSVIKLILVVPSESREVWDRIGRFKRQYPMYDYELWTPEKLHQFSGPRGKLGW